MPRKKVETKESPGTSIMVRATALGTYGMRRWRAGAMFAVASRDDLRPWMLELTQAEADAPPVEPEPEDIEFTDSDLTRGRKNKIQQ